jgi:hypothetical protein
VPIPAPRTTRDTFELLAEFDGPINVEQFLRAIDWHGVSLHQVYSAFLDRLPESVGAVQHHLRFDAITQAAATLQSAEFQSRVIELAFRAYPEKRRLFHVHIPKSAGVDLREALVMRYPYIHYNHSQRESTKVFELLTHLAEFSRRARVSKEILVTGHIPLLWYVQRGLCRYGDRIFTVLRHPVHGLLSLVNYYLRRIREDPHCKSPDTKSYAAYLGVSAFPERPNQDEQRTFGLSMLLNKEMMRGNLATHMLGTGTAASAIELIVRTNIELVPLEMYNKWLIEEWDMHLETRANQSQEVLRVSDLDRKSIDFLQEFCREDVALYKRVMFVHQKHGGTRINGIEMLGH